VAIPQLLHCGVPKYASFVRITSIVEIWAIYRKRNNVPVAAGDTCSAFHVGWKNLVLFPDT
jgi:hypothetical protein